MSDMGTSVPGRGAMDLDRVSELSHAVLNEVERAVVGKREPLRLVLSGILAGGHVLMEDFPGLGKTLAARSSPRPRAVLQTSAVHA